jgi:hypothetical protein
MWAMQAEKASHRRHRLIHCLMGVQGGVVRMVGHAHSNPVVVGQKEAGLLLDAHLLHHEE